MGGGVNEQREGEKSKGIETKVEGAGQRVVCNFMVGWEEVGRHAQGSIEGGPRRVEGDSSKA